MTRNEVVGGPHKILATVVLIAVTVFLLTVSSQSAEGVHNRGGCSGGSSEVWTCRSSTPVSGVPLRYVIISYYLGAWEFYAIRGETKVVLASGPQGSGGGTGVVTPLPGDIMEGAIYAPDPCPAPSDIYDIYPPVCNARGAIAWTDLPEDDGSLQGATTCEFKATASFDPPLMLAPMGTHDLRVDGALSGCRHTGGVGAPADASVRVGGILITPAHPADEAEYGITEYRWQEPIGQLRGNCLNVSGSGVSFTLWGDFGLTITEFEVRSAYAGLSMTGRVLDSYDLEAVNVVSHRQPATLTLTTTRDRGGLVTGAMVVTSAGNPTCTGEGLSSAGWSTASTLQTIVP